MEPEDRKKENVVIYEEGVVEFYINVYKTAKSYNEKVIESHRREIYQNLFGTEPKRR